MLVLCAVSSVHDAPLHFVKVVCELVEFDGRNAHLTPVDIFRSYQVGDILPGIPDKHVTLIYDSLTNAFVREDIL